MTTPLPDWSARVAAMMRMLSETEPLLALMAEQARGSIIVALTTSPTGGLILVVSDTEDDSACVTLDRATATALRDALDRGLS